MPRWLGLLALALVPATALANEGTDIASAMDEGDPFDLFVSVNYAFEVKNAKIKREANGIMGTTPIPQDSPIPLVRDLVYKQQRHVLTPRAQVGIFHDLELSLAMPIVLSDTRNMHFDQTADPCIFPGGPQQPTCVNAENSLTLRPISEGGSALLPLDATNMGYDAEDPNGGFNPVSDTHVFRGVNRSGLDQIHLGIAWAPMNQARDDTKPTWVIGTEWRISVGKIARFDRLNPGSEDGVSTGVHQLRAYTSLSKRTIWAEPFVTFWWLAPLSYRGTSPDDRDGSLFWEVGYGSESHQIQQQAGTHFGFEAIPWENPRQQQRISIEFSGRLESHFEGRGYSEMWEVFAFAGDPAGPTRTLVLDREPTAAGSQEMAHPGVTVIENYLSWAGRFGVRGQVGPNAKFSALFDIMADQKHRISWTDAGNESSADADDVITPGTNEVNPLHAPNIDLTGRNYVTDDSVVYTFMVNGTVMF